LVGGQCCAKSAQDGAEQQNCGGWLKHAGSICQLRMAHKKALFFNDGGQGFQAAAALQSAAAMQEFLGSFFQKRTASCDCLEFPGFHPGY